MLRLRSRQAILGRVERRRRALEAQTQLLQTLSYQSVLKRGYALVRDDAGRAVRSVAGIAAGTRLEIEIGDGRFGATTDGRVTPGPVVDEGGARKPMPRPAGPARAQRPRQPPGGQTPGGQGSLF